MCCLSLLLCMNHFFSVKLCALFLCLLWAVFALCGVSGTQAGQLCGGMSTGELKKQGSDVSKICAGPLVLC